MEAYNSKATVGSLILLVNNFSLILGKNLHLVDGQPNSNLRDIHYRFASEQRARLDNTQF